MEDRPTNAYIPPNLNSTGGLLGGMIDTRRLIEAAIGVAFAAFLFVLLKPFVPLIIISYACIAIGVGLGAVCLLGIRGEPFSIFLLNIFNYEHRRIFVTLRPPMPETAKKKREDEEDEDIEDNKLVALLRGGRK